MSLRIHGLTVCVDYAEYLAVSLPFWMQGLTSVMVVTSQTDVQTRQTLSLLNQHPRIRPTSLHVYLTDAFTRDGAAFNKGLAMEEARRLMPWEDWILFFDVDVVPPYLWHLNLPELQLGYLYGAKRYHTPDLQHLFSTKLNFVPDDRVGYGYFQLFHTKDPKVQKTPLLDTQWRHAGNYDSNFMLSFRSMVQDVGFPVWHIGPQHENWFGKGQRAQFLEMLARRNGMGIQDSEKL